MSATDILITGTGSFAGRILCDLAATATEPVSVVIAGRNAEQLNWLRTAASARALTFGRPVTVESYNVDLHSQDSTAACLSKLKPRVIVQSASAQPANVISGTVDAWSKLIAETSLSASALFQAYLSIKVAREAKRHVPDSFFVNCCYPDVANTILKALDLPVSCGLGNVAILSAIFAAHERGRGRNVKVLAHYQTITPWRAQPDMRRGPVPRVWIDDSEVGDVFGSFADVKLTPAPVIDVSGSANVPMLVAMATGKSWSGHAPGPHGLPGGYPIAVENGKLDLALPRGLSRDDAVAWNAKFEREDGLSVVDGRLVFAGNHLRKLRELSPELAKGFAVADFDAAHDELVKLRARLQASG